MKPTEPQQTAQASLIDKLQSRGPQTLTGEEMKWLHGAFEDITQEILQLRRLNSGYAAALYRKRLQLTHTDNPDGSVSFDLQPAPPDAEPPSVGDAPVSMN